MKNCVPLVFGPLFTMETTPGDAGIPAQSLNTIFDSGSCGVSYSHYITGKGRGNMRIKCRLEFGVNTFLFKVCLNILTKC